MLVICGGGEVAAILGGTAKNFGAWGGQKLEGGGVVNSFWGWLKNGGGKTNWGWRQQILFGGQG